MCYPISLIYGMEAVLLIEVEILSLKVLVETKLEEAEWVKNRYNQLNLIEEKCMKAICHSQMYQRHMIRAHDKKIPIRQFHLSKLLLKKILVIHKDARGK